MRKPPSAAAILLGAATMVERRGLARGALQDEGGAVCATRALMAQVLGGSFLVPWWEDPAEAMPDGYARALRAVARHLGWPDWWTLDLTEEQVICWNDTADVTAGLVCEVLRGAAYGLTVTPLVFDRG